MRRANTPQVGARYWVALCVASVFGANCGDFASHVLGLGHVRGLPVLALLFAAVLLGERRSAGGAPGVRSGAAGGDALLRAARSTAAAGRGTLAGAAGIDAAGAGRAGAAQDGHARTTGMGGGDARGNEARGNEAQGDEAQGNEAWYWAAIVILRTAATNLADLATHDLRLGYLRVIAGLAALLVLLCLAGQGGRAATASAADRVVAPGAAPGATATAGGLPRIDGWYWARMLTAGTLGTALGDFIADGLGLGTGIGTLALGAVLAGVLALGARRRWTGRAAYWGGIVAVRSAGTTAGDFLVDRSGLGFGLPLGTGASGALLVAVLLLWRRPAARPVRGAGAPGLRLGERPG